MPRKKLTQIPKCVECKSTNIVKRGYRKRKNNEIVQKYCCRDCNRQFLANYISGKLPSKKYGDEIKEKAIAFAKSGFTITEISSRINVPRPTIKHWFRDIDIDIVRKKRHNEYSDEIKEQARILAKSGLNIREISERVNVPYSTIVYWGRIHDINIVRIVQRVRHSKYSDEIKQKAITLAESGLTIREISKCINVLCCTIKGWFRGIDIVRPSKHSDEIKEQARTLVKLGLPVSQVSEHINVPCSTIQAWVKDINIVHKKKYSQYSDEIEEKAVTLVKSGLPISQVSRRIKVPYPVIAYWVRGIDVVPLLGYSSGRKEKP